MGEVISLAVRIAFILAAMGCLKPATLFLMREVAKQHQQGLVSLTELTHSLQTGQPMRKHH